MKQEIINNNATPAIIPCDVHQISIDDICEYALKVLQRFDDTNYQAYLVGGSVRDLLLRRKPKDFDIATNALPEEARKLFANGRLIGRRFRLLHVRYGRNIIEVATFRGHHDGAQAKASHDAHIDNGMIVRDNVYGTMEEDAWRRDFTINALYLNTRDMAVIDYTGGMGDLSAGLIRMIGDPMVRYQEDPVRMLRAVRFAAKLGFKIDPDTDAPIYKLKDRLTAVPPARLFEEILKLFLSGHGLASYRLLRRYQLFRYLFPLTDECLEANQDSIEPLIVKGLTNTDWRIAQGKPVTPAFLFAIMLWQPMRVIADRLQLQGLSPLQSTQIASTDVFSQQAEHVSLPKRFTLQTREIWGMQYRLEHRQGCRALRLLENKRFRAGYDFLLLRQESGVDELEELCEWWTRFQVENQEEQSEMINSLQPKRRSRRGRSKKRKVTVNKPSS